MLIIVSAWICTWRKKFCLAKNIGKAVNSQEPYTSSWLCYGFWCPKKHSLRTPSPSLQLEQSWEHKHPTPASSTLTCTTGIHLVQNSALGIYWRTALPNMPLIRGENTRLLSPPREWNNSVRVLEEPIRRHAFWFGNVPTTEPLMQTTDCGHLNDCLHHALWLETHSVAAPAMSPALFYTATWAAEMRFKAAFV